MADVQRYKDVLSAFKVIPLIGMENRIGVSRDGVGKGNKGKYRGYGYIQNP